MKRACMGWVRTKIQGEKTCRGEERSAGVRVANIWGRGVRAQHEGRCANGVRLLWKPAAEEAVEEPAAG